MGLAHEIRLPYQWQPREYQKPLWRYLASGGKRSVSRWHRRSGKDEVYLHHTACAAHERIGNYWYMLPEASQARKAMWDSINPHTGKRRIDEAFPEELRAGYRDQEMMIPFKCGSTFQIVGSDNFNSLVGAPPIGLVLSEFALANPAAWGYMMPILEENGGWVGFNSTPRGKNHFKSLCEMAAKEKDWFYSVVTARDTGIFTDEQLQRILRQLQAQYGEEYGYALWLQEYYVSFDAAVPGSIWGDAIAKLESSGRSVEFEVASTFPVNTGWDLGRTDDTSIWWYTMSGQKGVPPIDVFDFFSKPFMDVCNEDDHSKSLVHLLLKVRDKYDIRYGTHWLPHDARPRTQAAGGKSILMQFIDAKKKYPQLGDFRICPRLDKQEGIQAARATFPHCRFHSTACADGIEALRHYHREWDAELMMFNDNPVHDWSSHPSDAWRTVALTWKIPPENQPVIDPHAAMLAGNPTKQPLGVLTKRHLAKKAAERSERM